MKLIEVLGQSQAWEDDDATIYVEEPWSCESEAVLISPAPASTEPMEQEGRRYVYFLETFLAREFIEGYLGTAEGAAASTADRCVRLISYARNDA